MNPCGSSSSSTVGDNALRFSYGKKEELCPIENEKLRFCLYVGSKGTLGNMGTDSTGFGFSSKIDGPSHWNPPNEPHFLSLLSLGSSTRTDKLPLLDGLPTAFHSGSSCWSLAISIAFYDMFFNIKLSCLFILQTYFILVFPV
jgi:hypothetical protein